MTKTKLINLAENGEEQQRNTGRNSPRKEFHRVIEKIRNLPKRDEASPSSSNLQQPPIEDEDITTHQGDETETMSSASDQTIAVPAINFKRYLGAASVRYTQMGNQPNRDYQKFLM